VRAKYTAKQQDELNVEMGHLVVVEHHYNDGWAFGYNLRYIIYVNFDSTGQEGIFPLGITYPWTENTKFILITSPNAFQYGSEIISGSQLAYPEWLTVHQMEMVNALDIVDILSPIWDFKDKFAQIAIVCGSDMFNSMAVDSLIDFGASTSDIKIMGSSNWLENY
jgi:hypothetical protein